MPNTQTRYPWTPYSEDLLCIRLASIKLNTPHLAIQPNLTSIHISQSHNPLAIATTKQHTITDIGPRILNENIHHDNSELQRTC